MARTSPVWDTMLFGPFLEGQAQQATADNWTVALPEDDPDALLILLRATHGDLVAIPGVLSRDQLLRLVVLCDKYDTVGTLRTFWEPWVNQVDPGALSLDTFVAQLQIAHTLGYYHYFAATLVVVLSHLRKGENDTLVFQGESGDEIIDESVHLGMGDLNEGSSIHPPSVAVPHTLTGIATLEDLARGRIQLFFEAVQGPYNATNRLTAPGRASDPCCRSRNTDNKWRTLCDRAVLGGLHRVLDRSKLPFSVLEGDNSVLVARPENLDGFLLLLERVRTSTITEAGISVMTTDGQNHTRCGPWHKIDRGDVLGRFLYTVMEVVYVERDSFTRQQGKSGVIVPSGWNDLEIPPPRLFAHAMTSLGVHGYTLLTPRA